MVVLTPHLCTLDSDVHTNPEDKNFVWFKLIFRVPFIPVRFQNIFININLKMPVFVLSSFVKYIGLGQ